MTPSQIVNYLDQHVVGQEEAKRQLAVAIYTHYKKIALAEPDKVEIIKSNVLLVGPTGTGKTLICETLARVLQVPFVTANATSLAQSEFVNDEIEAILLRLIDKAEGDRLFPGITGILNQDMADVEALDIRQTPTFFLNGRRLESFSAESLIADVQFAVENP